MTTHRAVALIDSWRFWAGVAYVIVSLVAVLAYIHSNNAQADARNATSLSIAVAQASAESVYATCLALREAELHVVHPLIHRVPVISLAECQRRRDAILESVA